jgi:hypothetical protein
MLHSSKTLNMKMSAAEKDLIVPGGSKAEMADGRSKR